MMFVLWGMTICKRYFVWKEKLFKPVNLTGPCGKGLSSLQASRSHENLKDSTQEIRTKWSDAVNSRKYVGIEDKKNNCDSHLRQGHKQSEIRYRLTYQNIKKWRAKV